MKALIILGLTCSLSSLALAETPEQWRARKLADIEFAKTAELGQAWERLSSIFNSLGRKVPDRAHPDEIEIFEEAQRAIMDRPGYAWRVYKDIQARQKELMTSVELNRKNSESLNSNGVNILAHNYLNEIKWSFESLSYLPSEETVEVLAKFLEDDRTGRHGSVKNGFEGLFPESTDIPSNSRRAVDALKHLEVGPIPGAENFLPKTFGSPEEAEIYKEWWAEVQAGKRDYHFGWKAWDRSKILPKDQWPPDPYAPVTATHKVLPTNTSPQVSAPKEKNLNWALYSSGLLVLVASLVAWNRKPQS